VSKPDIRTLLHFIRDRAAAPRLDGVRARRAIKIAA